MGRLDSGLWLNITYKVLLKNGKVLSSEFSMVVHNENLKVKSLTGHFCQ